VLRHSGAKIEERRARPGRGDDHRILPHVRRFRVRFLDAETLIRATPEFFEYPMCDRDPLPRWTRGRVTSPTEI
jgi:hypothetical protein